jgi:hypothetical protein
MLTGVPCPCVCKYTRRQAERFSTNGTKRRKGIGTKVINAEWDIILNGKEHRREIMLNVINANGT